MTPILALDLATSTGWAMRAADGTITSGVETFRLGRGDSPGIRFMRFRAWLWERLAGFHGVYGVVAYERPHHRGGHATALAVGLATVVQEQAAADRHETLTVHTGTLKKWATGRGNAGKDAMVAAARLRYGRDVTSHDEADALHVLAWSCAEIGEPL